METSLEQKSGQTEHQAACDHQWTYLGRSRDAEDRCERPNRLGCRVCDWTITTPCQRGSRAQCDPCGRRYHQRVKRVFESGWDDRGMVLMLTLTAPGAVQHSMPSGDVCPCTGPEGTNLAAWNATAGLRWSHLMTYLRREYGDDLQYAKGHELQKRGAIHYHALMRVRPGVASRMLREKRVIRSMAIARGFGHEVDLAPTRTEGAANYCAKYVSKACDQRENFPWMDLKTGELMEGAPRFRPWSASRKWGATMKGLRAAERLWAMLHQDQGDDDGKRSVSAAPLDSLSDNYTPPTTIGIEELRELAAAGLV